MTFSIWDASAGGTELWTETQPNVLVSNGVFSVQLGAAASLPATVFEDSSTYLQINIGGETGSTRQRFVATPYAFRASLADDVSPGSVSYIHNSNSLQSGATFYISSGTISGPLHVGGILYAGTDQHALTTAEGLIDAIKLDGTLPSARLSGTYSQSLSFSSNTNSYAGDGSGLLNVIAQDLMAGDTDYIHNTNTLQPGSTFYVSSGTVLGSFNALGQTRLGGAPGVADVSIYSNLIVSGDGPHEFTGDIRIKGNDLQDSDGTSRITLGENVTVNGDLQGPSGEQGVQISTPIIFSSNANGDNFVAFPFTAGGAIANRDIVIISGANTVSTTTTGSSAAVVGIAVTSAALGETVYVATIGTVTGVTANAAITAGSGRICTTTVAGRVVSCNTNGAVLGKALTGTTAAGQTVKVIITHGY